MYGYLQVNSSWDGIKGSSRYVMKKDINFSKMGEALGITRQTASKKFKDLVAMGLIEQSGDTYYLKTLDAADAKLLPNDTVRILTNALSQNSISIYCYLFNRYFANNNKPFTFLYSHLKKHCGLSVSTRSNDYIIQDILKVLEQLGLIELQKISKVETTGDFKDIYQINKVNLKLKEC